MQEPYRHVLGEGEQEAGFEVQFFFNNWGSIFDSHTCYLCNLLQKTISLCELSKNKLDWSELPKDDLGAREMFMAAHVLCVQKTWVWS